MIERDGGVEFHEVLPDGCPPVTAEIVSKSVLLRFVEREVPVFDDFVSHAALGKPVPPGVCPCRWASCSFFRVEKIGKLPSIKNKPFIAYVELDHTAGLCNENAKNGHMDVWLSTKFDPNRAVTNVIRRSQNA
ncbi:hypothetical protein GCM10007301_44890 [Azorhizobium oxalatiphilum]|uniref:Uncharacterized protein n=1 Tax=Azorhizobium oxalatiphilum TaxID=980631 RepID=A0A917FI95_9HYPH|nr:hypothetical protein [Azorhizobium oxalatiphilum]GGF79811.1 hypothetical protein GCM10007301_44890 [Azorhizobium oxalatiphilum]